MRFQNGKLLRTHSLVTPSPVALEVEVFSLRPAHSIIRQNDEGVQHDLNVNHSGSLALFFTC